MPEQVTLIAQNGKPLTINLPPTETQAEWSQWHSCEHPELGTLTYRTMNYRVDVPGCKTFPNYNCVSQIQYDAPSSAKLEEYAKKNPPKKKQPWWNKLLTPK